MKMLRHYFISSDLDDLERFEEELERAGIANPQIHCLSLDDTSVENHHHLHEVSALMKKDLIHAGEYGVLIGVVAAALVLGVTSYAGWHESPAGWIPFVFLAIILLGFFTWEGGLWGVQTPNAHFKRFEEALKAGKHVFFVDSEPGQEADVGDRSHGTSGARHGRHGHCQSALDRDLEHAAQAFFRRDDALNDQAGWVQPPPLVKNRSRVRNV